MMTTEIDFAAELSPFSLAGQIEDQRSPQEAAMMRELDQLPVRERSLLALYYHEGLQFNELAAVFGITEALARQVHACALARLRAMAACRLSEQYSSALSFC